MSVEGVVGCRVEDPTDTPEIRSILSARQLPVLVDPDCVAATELHPVAIVDGRMTKGPPEPFRHAALMYVGLGPGFEAPLNCYAVVETERGHSMGRVIMHGAARQDSRRPDGDAVGRVLRSPEDGLLDSSAQIGQHFEPGDLIASVDGRPVLAPFKGVLRGLLRPGTRALKEMKIGDIDARDDPALCSLVSDKSLAVGGGVLEALLGQPKVRAQLWA